MIDDCTSPHCREALCYRARRSFNLRSRWYISRLQQTFHLTSLNYDSRFTSSWKFATKSITIRLLSVLQDRNCDTLLLERTQAINRLQKVWSKCFGDGQFQSYEQIPEGLTRILSRHFVKTDQPLYWWNKHSHKRGREPLVALETVVALIRKQPRKKHLGTSRNIAWWGL